MSKVQFHKKLTRLAKKQK